MPLAVPPSPWQWFWGHVPGFLLRHPLCELSTRHGFALAWLGLSCGSEAWWGQRGPCCRPQEGGGGRGASPLLQPGASPPSWAGRVVRR